MVYFLEYFLGVFSKVLSHFFKVYFSVVYFLEYFLIIVYFLTNFTPSHHQQIATQTATTVQVKPSQPPPAAAQKIVISKNIVGRVIPISASVLANSTKITLPNGSPFTVQPPEKIVKYVIQKPLVQKVMPTVIPTPENKQIVARNSTGSAKNTEALYLEFLRPWLRKPCTKNAEATKAMLNPTSLSALFKCMGTSCNFYTSDSAIFLRHLTFHGKFMPNDRKNYMTCCYCVFETPEGRPQDIVDHIHAVHGCDKFQCSYCFYRSCVDFNVLTHQNNFHKMKPRKIFELPVKGPRSDSEELEMVKRKRVDVVPPIICVFCRAVFYVFKSFLNHINEHENALNTKCIKCGDRTTKATLHKHLVNCHGFGLFQCVYCRFGTNTFEIISSHIANEHPSKLPLFCERSEYKTMNFAEPPHPSSIESTCLKHINQHVPSSVIVKPSIEHAALRNYSNMGCLGNNIHIRGFAEEAPVVAPVKTLLSAEEAPMLASYKPNHKEAPIMYVQPKNVEAPFITMRPKESQTLKSIRSGEMRVKTTSLVESIKKPIKKNLNDSQSPKPPQQRFKIPKEVEAPLVVRRNSIPMHRLSSSSPVTKEASTALRQLKGSSNSKLAAPEPKKLGLQIQSVFSLSDSAVQGGFQQATKFLISRNSDE
jgi:hypothetical protein